MEKRGCRRKIKRLNITFADENEEYSGISSDFSCKGLFIRTRKGFREGITLHMQLEIENGVKIPLHGTVRRSLKPSTEIHKSGMGVELISIPAEYVDFIEKLYKD